ncbi:aspartate aminotransferase [Candidatus Saccharibacteria bacterium]|nr:MAG: aspartate aminotransferase [Candidatus Saccharibacteria bacterium]
MHYLADRLSCLDSSDFRTAMRYRLSLKNPIDLSIGIPEEPTPEYIKTAGIRAIQNDKTTYLPGNGLLDLRKAIAEKLQSENHLNCSADTVSVVPGLTTGLLLVYLTVLNPGDEVIIPDPYYPPYPQLAEAVGARAVIVPTQANFQLDIAAIRAAITPKTKLLVINSPNNPSGAVYPEATLRAVARLADAHDILVLSDEIYEHFVYDVDHFSIGSMYPKTLTLGGFSKAYAMTGWRLGYVTGPDPIINALNELLQYSVMSSSSIAQYAALEGLRKQPDITGKLCEKYHEKRDFVCRALVEMGFTVEGAQGAYYVLLKTPNGMNDRDFAELAAKHGIVVVAGRAFSKTHDRFRISYGGSMDTLRRGMDGLSRVVKL